MSAMLVAEGSGPLIFGQPHVGTMIPPEVSVTMNDLGRAAPDTDWWIDDLYAPLVERFQASVVRQTVSRYVIDVNRDPFGASLYPGQATTELCPTTTFAGEPIYRAGAEPNAAEIARRRMTHFEPFHAALAGRIERALIRHGFCLLFDCHSIRSEVPRLFDGVLPTFNFGTNSGRACHPAVKAAGVATLSACGETWVADGRFKGGWITRHHGQPSRNVQAVQMEIAQVAYMDEAPPWTFAPGRADRTRAVLSDLIAALLAAAAQAPREPLA
jgi:N-formylglutamate deformylase